MWHAWERRIVYKVLVGKLEGRRPLGKPRSRWEDGIGIDLKRTDWGAMGIECIHLAQDRDKLWALVNAAATACTSFYTG
jgi:hypothetical protein